MGNPRTLELKGDLATMPYLLQMRKTKSQDLDRRLQGLSAGQTELSLPGAGVSLADPSPLSCSALRQNMVFRIPL